MNKCFLCFRKLKRGFTSKRGTVHGKDGERKAICKWCHENEWKAFIASIDPDDEH